MVVEREVISREIVQARMDPDLEADQLDSRIDTEREEREAEVHHLQEAGGMKEANQTEAGVRVENNINDLNEVKMTKKIKEN